jgi:hypothetical protein
VSSRPWLGLAAALVLLPATAVVLVATDVLHVDGGHGLASWLCISACAVTVLVGTLLGAVVAALDARVRPWALALVVLGAAALVAFLLRYGPPFAS